MNEIGKTGGQTKIKREPEKNNTKLYDSRRVLSHKQCNVNECGDVLQRKKVIRTELKKV